MQPVHLQTVPHVPRQVERQEEADGEWNHDGEQANEKGGPFLLHGTLEIHLHPSNEHVEGHEDRGCALKRWPALHPRKELLGEVWRQVPQDGGTKQHAGEELPHHNWLPQLPAYLA